MKKTIAKAWVAAAAFLLIAIPAAYAQDRQKAVFDEIIDLYKTHDVVLFGEEHDRQWNHDFRLALLRYPKFIEAVNDIVIECGNSLYQDLLDDYIVKLKDVPAKDLQLVWRNTTQVSGVWDSPLYEEFIRAVRKVNEALDPGKRIRLIAGDPPIDWTKITTRGEYAKYATRDETPFKIIENEIIKKNRKGFVIYGSLHLVTLKNGLPAPVPAGAAQVKRPAGPTPPPKTVATFLKDEYPGKAYAIFPLSVSGGKIEDFKKITGIVDQAPYLLKLAGTPHENRSAKEFFRFPIDEPLGQITDSILFFGLTPNEIVFESPASMNDVSYQRELKRRREILGFTLPPSLQPPAVKK